MAANKKKDFGLVVWVFGWLLSLIVAISKIVKRRSIPFEAFEWLASDAGANTLDRMIALVHTDWLAEQPKPVEQQPQGGHPYRDPPTNGTTLPKDHYRVSLKYAGMPSMDALKKEWGKDNVSVIFDGRPFTLHASCVGMDRTPGEKVFCLHDTGSDWESEAEIAKALERRDQFAPNGRRPATEEETYEFAMAHPELVDFVGLGSFAVGGAGRGVAYVWRSDGQRVLGLVWVGGRFRRRLRVLLVSK